MKHHLRGTEPKGSRLRVVLYVVGAEVDWEIGKRSTFRKVGDKPELDRWNWLSNPVTVARVLPPGSM